MEDNVLNALVEQTIKVAVDELAEQMKLRPQSVQTIDAFTTTSRLTTAGIAAEAQTDLLNESISNSLKASYDKQLKDQLRKYSHTFITNMINDCFVYLDEKNTGDGMLYSLNFSAHFQYY